jgi:hypothetical protein
MNKQPKLWEILAAFLPIIAGITMWLWNLSTKVERQATKIEYIENNQLEYKQDIKEINQTLKTISLQLENKQNRK